MRNDALFCVMCSRVGSDVQSNVEKARGHPGLNQGPLDLQSNALPLSYIPIVSSTFKKEIVSSIHFAAVAAKDPFSGIGWIKSGMVVAKGTKFASV